MGNLLYVSFLVTSIFLSKDLPVSYNGIIHLSCWCWPISLSGLVLAYFTNQCA